MLPPTPRSPCWPSLPLPQGARSSLGSMSTPMYAATDPLPFRSLLCRIPPIQSGALWEVTAPLSKGPGSGTDTVLPSDLQDLL